MLEVESFLRSRNFKVEVAFELREAVRYITEERPDFSLLSTELIPLKSKWLFSVLRQLTQPILFVERFNAKGLAVTREHSDLLVLEPPITPHGFEQTLRRIERDHRKQNEVASKLNEVNLWIMSTLSDIALKASCRPAAEGTKIEKADHASRITCFRVESGGLRGHFILVYGQNRVIEPTWTEELQQHLNTYLSTFEDSLSFKDKQVVNFERVKLDKWTKEHAQFVHQAIHEDAELVLAFFKERVGDELKTSPEADHLEVDLNHIQGDKVVNFDVYIYLPQNARFVLYTPRGGTLYESQKQKLLGDGIQSVHIHKKSLDDFRRHQSQKFLEDSAAGYRA